MSKRIVSSISIIVIALFACAGIARAGVSPGEDLYRFLSKKIMADRDSAFIENLAVKSRDSDWPSAKKIELTGNLRILAVRDADDSGALFFIRGGSGDMYIVSRPETGGPTRDEYESMSKNRMIFTLETVNGEHEGRAYTFARIAGEPKGILLDRMFKVLIVLMLFFVMVGMGLTLKISDFTLVFSRPLAIILGIVLLYGIMPLAALGLSHLFGYYHAYPYIYLGLILAAATPAAVTSNLLTHFSKGDLALSISLTSISTILALFSMPLLLSLYGKTASGATVPAMLIAQTIIVLVIVPLAVGMTIRARFEKVAVKASPVFSAMGLITVIFIIVTGVIANINVLADTERYNLRFYLAPMILAAIGIILGFAVARIFRLSVKQVRSLSFETGMRNSALALTIAILIQDQIGDFYSSLFMVNGVYGIAMYVPALIAVQLFRRSSSAPDA
ncbi:MAG TPA: bile acid:sodium symporter family protein [Spirochaetota bacterium]|nr:bile acid:sodium symporter family protein [Spirochaetota bacterium]HPI90985.1 bile acid:sodium symporter family protein [Spirochaetota bacterium]HPR49451.1 bile acid:sodium symporter family protein [Spirochaetota bacterium]